jgi:hypothetical protein
MAQRPAHDCTEKLMTIQRFLIGTALALSALAAQAYTVGGAKQSLISDSFEWAWDGSYMTGLRSALQNPSNFGPAGIVNRSITTVDMAVVDSTTLAGVNMFVGTWVSDGQAAGFSTAVRDFFLGGGDLFLLQDDSGHDGLGTALGISTTNSTGSVSNGGAPLFQGPFGNATNVTQHYNVGQLDEAAILAKNGHVAGRNAQNQVTSAYWAAGEYAAGSGALFIIADIDMVATTTTCGLAVCGADYLNMNSNAIYALNTFSFLQRNGGNPNPASAPGTLVLAGSALFLLARARRRS